MLDGSKNSEKDELASLRRELAELRAQQRQPDARKEAEAIDKFRGKFLCDKPPPFTGTSDDMTAQEWFETVENVLELNKVPVDRWLASASTFLRGDARRHFLSIKPQLYAPPPNQSLGTERTDESAASGQEVWSKFKEEMFTSFGTMQDEHIALNLLVNLRQGGTLQAYAQRLKQLAARVVSEPMTEREKVHRFLKGLKEPLKSKCLFKTGTTETVDKLSDLVAQATRVEAVLGVHAPRESSVSHAARGSKNNKRNRSPSNRPKHQHGQQGKRPKTSNRGEKGASTPGLSGIKQSVIDERKSAGQCLKCAESGHSWVACPNSKKGPFAPVGSQKPNKPNNSA